MCAQDAGSPDSAIRELRMGTLSIRTRPAARVRVTQLRHEFWFGTAIGRGAFSDGANPEDRERYLSILRTLFNAAVHENALKWPATEAQQGKLTYDGADTMLDWCDRHGIPMRGHCIFWAADGRAPDWVRNLDDAALREAVRRRAAGVTARYRGRISEYDVNNEMLHADFYTRRLGEDVVADMFRFAREGDPNAVLYTNDYNILCGDDADKYEAQIERLLDRGIPVGGIGCQGHFGKPPDVGTARLVLDRLAKFNLPIKVTEFDIDTSDEEAKANALGDFYRMCFAHPAVNGILMWGFWESAHWRPRAALWKKDFTPTPAAEAYRDLVYGEWWTTWEGTADGDGRCELRAFYGRHRVEANGEKVEVDLPKAAGKVAVDIGR